MWRERKNKKYLRQKKMISPTLILCIDEPKLDKTFPDSQFQIENYQYPLFPRDRNWKGGGRGAWRIVYVIHVKASPDYKKSKELKILNLKLLKLSVLNLQFQKGNGMFYLHISLQVLTKDFFLKKNQAT